MRKIIFRGYSSRYKKWVVGDLIQRPNNIKHILVLDEQRKCYDNYEVDSESIGQLTGVTDKNGQKIFEGDMLHDYYIDDDGTIVDCPKQVSYCSKTGCFGIDSSYSQDNSQIEPIRCYFGSDPIEIVGNIYDKLCP